MTDATISPPEWADVAKMDALRNLATELGGKNVAVQWLATPPHHPDEGPIFSVSARIGADMYAMSEVILSREMFEARIPHYEKAIRFVFRNTPGS